MESKLPNIVVVGGGLVGLVSALALAQALGSGGTVELVAPKSRKADRRTTAMLQPTIEFLRRLDAWGDLEAVSAPLKTMRILDATNRLIRAPTVEFDADEIGLDAFGYNVPNEQAAKLLRNRLNRAKNLTVIEEKAVSFDRHTGILETEMGKKLRAQLFVAADGRNSMLRSAAEFEVTEHSYPQTAIVLSFTHSLPHGDVSTELHTRSGPFTQVPLPKNEKSDHRSSLVWVVATNEAERWAEMEQHPLEEEIEARLQSSLGKVSIEGPPQLFPLTFLSANRMGKNNVVLVGEAAHVIPPIGAQGFNLGANDISALYDLIAKDAEFDRLGDTYGRTRRSEVFTKTRGINALNKSLLSGFLPLQMGRFLSLGALSQSSHLRQVLMKGILNGPASLFTRDKEPVSSNQSRP